MLKYMVEKLTLREDHWHGSGDELTRLSPLSDYVSNLCYDGFLCRRKHVIYEDVANHLAYVCGILGHSSAWEDARRYPDLAKRQSEIDSELSYQRNVQYFDHDHDFSYCQHNDWKTLFVVGDHVYGPPPLMCGDCGGVVAPYRLDITRETRSALWCWAIQYGWIDDLWVFSGEYETWAERTLFDIHSPINDLGASVVKSLAEELSCEVYLLYETNDKVFSTCPQCGQSWEPVLLPGREYKRCARCRIMI